MPGWKCHLWHDDIHGNEAASSVSLAYGLLNFIAAGVWVVMVTPDSVMCSAWLACHFKSQKSCALIDQKCILPFKYEFQDVLG